MSTPRKAGTTTQVGAGMFVAAWVLLLGILTLRQHAGS